MQIFSHPKHPNHNYIWKELRKEENVTTKNWIFNSHETTYSIRVVN